MSVLACFKVNFYNFLVGAKSRLSTNSFVASE